MPNRRFVARARAYTGPKRDMERIRVAVQVNDAGSAAFANTPLFSPTRDMTLTRIVGKLAVRPGAAQEEAIFALLIRYNGADQILDLLSPTANTVITIKDRPVQSLIWDTPYVNIVGGLEPYIVAFDIKAQRKLEPGDIVAMVRESSAVNAYQTALMNCNMFFKVAF